MIVSYDTIITMKPPYEITSEILESVAKISVLIGKYEGIHFPKPSPQLRKENKIRSIHSSLAIEGNTLSPKQITAILEGKRVLGAKKDILEVQNALKLYEQIEQFKPFALPSFLQAHKIVLAGLIDKPGVFRSQHIGVLEGSKVRHMPPPYSRVPGLMKNLFSYLNAHRRENLLILSCVFHYECEFIHPFVDGNGRMGRFWQSVLLNRHHPIFKYVPIESMIREKQEHYYEALRKSDLAGKSTAFVEFMLEVILKSLSQFLSDLRPVTQTWEDRINIAQETFGKKPFQRKEYLALFKTLSTATASRDLANATLQNLLQMNGEKRNATYRF